MCVAPSRGPETADGMATTRPGSRACMHAARMRLSLTYTQYRIGTPRVVLSTHHFSLMAAVDSKSTCQDHPFVPACIYTHASCHADQQCMCTCRSHRSSTSPYIKNSPPYKLSEHCKQARPPPQGLWLPTIDSPPSAERCEQHALHRSHVHARNQRHVGQLASEVVVVSMCVRIGGGSSLDGLLLLAGLQPLNDAHASCVGACMADPDGQMGRWCGEARTIYTYKFIYIDSMRRRYHRSRENKTESSSQFDSNPRHNAHTAHAHMHPMRRAHIATLLLHNVYVCRYGGHTR